MDNIINYESHTHKRSHRGKTGNNTTQMGISAVGSDVQGHLISDSPYMQGNGASTTTSPVLEVMGTRVKSEHHEDREGFLGLWFQ